MSSNLLSNNQGTVLSHSQLQKLSNKLNMFVLGSVDSIRSDILNILNVEDTGQNVDGDIKHLIELRIPALDTHISFVISFLKAYLNGSENNSIDTAIQSSITLEQLWEVLKGHLHKCVHTEFVAKDDSDLYMNHLSGFFIELQNFFLDIEFGDNSEFQIPQEVKQLFEEVLEKRTKEFLLAASQNFFQGTEDNIWSKEIDALSELVFLQPEEFQNMVIDNIRKNLEEYLMKINYKDLATFESMINVLSSYISNYLKFFHDVEIDSLIIREKILNKDIQSFMK